MKKGIFIPILAFFLLVIAGCSSNQAGKTVHGGSISKQSVTKVKKVFYDELSKKDKRNMKFKFTEAEDETADNFADPVYVLSMKVTNKTKKVVKFDKSKFIVYTSPQTKFQSVKSGTLVVKPGQTKKIHQLFEGVAEQSLVGSGSEFIYLNKDNRLAAANFTKGTLGTQSDKDDSDTSDTDDSDTSDTSDTDDTDYDTDESDSDYDSDDTDYDSSDTDTTDTDDDSEYPPLTLEQAKQQLLNGFSDAQSFGGSTIDELTPSRGTRPWSFISEYGEAWVSYDDGGVKGPGDHEEVYP